MSEWVFEAKNGNKKIFHLGIIKISALKLYKLFLIKLSAGIRVSSFLLDSLSKAKMFQNFSITFYFLTDFEI